MILKDLNNITMYVEFDTSWQQLAGDPCICLCHGNPWTADNLGVNTHTVI